MSRVDRILDAIAGGVNNRGEIARMIRDENTDRAVRAYEADFTSLNRVIDLVGNLAFVREVRPHQSRGYTDFMVLFSRIGGVRMEAVNVKVRSNVKGIETLLKKYKYRDEEMCIKRRLVILNGDSQVSDYEIHSDFINGVIYLEPGFVAPAPLLKNLKNSA